MPKESKSLPPRPARTSGPVSRSMTNAGTANLFHEALPGRKSKAGSSTESTDRQSQASTLGLPPPRAARGARPGPSRGAQMAPRSPMDNPDLQGPSRKRARSEDAEEAKEAAPRKKQATVQQRMHDRLRPREGEDREAAVRRLRAETPQEERDDMETRLAPHEDAEFGDEYEFPEVEIHPTLPQDHVIAELDGVKLRSEVLADLDGEELSEQTHHKTVVEATGERKTDRAAALRSAQAIADFMTRLANLAVATGRVEIPLSEVIEDLPPELANHCFVLRSTIPVAAGQTTGGVSLLKLDELLGHHPNYNRADLRRRTRAVAEELEKTCGMPASPEVKAFIKLLLYYVDEAGGMSPSDPMNVKSRFAFMSRSDFCSIYRHLLFRMEDRGMARVLLMPLQPGEDPLIMRASGMDGTKRMLGVPFPVTAQDGSIQDEAGPVRNEFFESIVLVSGSPAKDAMSGLNPSMGAKGVDRVRRLMLMELRELAERHGVAASLLMLKQTGREYDLLASFNPDRLGPPRARTPEETDEDSWTAVGSAAMAQVGKLHAEYLRARLEKTVEALDEIEDLAAPDQEQHHERIVAESTQAGLEAMRDIEVDEAIAELSDWLDSAEEAAEENDSEVHESVANVRAALTGFHAMESMASPDEVTILSAFQGLRAALLAVDG